MQEIHALKEWDSPEGFAKSLLMHPFESQDGLRVVLVYVLSLIHLHWAQSDSAHCESYVETGHGASEG